MKTHTLINFNIPNHLKTNFDHLVDFKRVSRTSVINTLIENYCRSELSHLQADGRINELISTMKTRPQPKRVHPRQYDWDNTMIVGTNYEMNDDDDLSHGGW
jgi:hypothetical protein